MILSLLVLFGVNPLRLAQVAYLRSYYRHAYSNSPLSTPAAASSDPVVAGQVLQEMPIAGAKAPTLRPFECAPGLVAIYGIENGEREYCGAGLLFKTGNTIFKDNGAVALATTFHQFLCVQRRGLLEAHGNYYALADCKVLKALKSDVAGDGDLVILSLPKNASSVLGVKAASIGRMHAGTQAMNLSWSVDGETWLHSRGQASLSLNGLTIEHHLQSDRGASGSPLYGHSGVVYGLHTGGVADPTGVYAKHNIGVCLSFLLDTPCNFKTDEGPLRYLTQFRGVSLEMIKKLEQKAIEEEDGEYLFIPYQGHDSEDYETSEDSVGELDYGRGTDDGGLRWEKPKLRESVAAPIPAAAEPPNTASSALETSVLSKAQIELFNKFCKDNEFKSAVLEAPAYGQRKPTTVKSKSKPSAKTRKPPQKPLPKPQVKKPNKPLPKAPGKSASVVKESPAPKQPEVPKDKKAQDFDSSPANGGGTNPKGQQRSSQGTSKSQKPQTSKDSVKQTSKSTKSGNSKASKDTNTKSSQTQSTSRKRKKTGKASSRKH